MNRRDLLKQSAVLALGLPALSASGLGQTCCGGEGNCLIVSFEGPFCFWQEQDHMKVMAPPVGENFHKAAHQAWVATTGNETMLTSMAVEHPPAYDLKIPSASTSSKAGEQNAIKTSGTPIFGYEQQSSKGANPLFNFTVPFPDLMVGVRPTYAGIGPSTVGNHKGQATILAAGVTFLYHNVDLNAVKLKKDGHNYYTPCFQNDASLPVANIAVHLSQINQRRSHNHLHAKHVWTQMLTMYPWMQSEFGNIDFPGFDISKCPPSPNTGVQYGPGNDCEVPIMLLSQSERVGHNATRTP